MVAYITHPVEVTEILADLGMPVPVLVAALLHDTLEDHPEEVTKADLERRFGPRVADLVVRCTDTPRPRVTKPTMSSGLVS